MSGARIRVSIAAPALSGACREASRQRTAEGKAHWHGRCESPGCVCPHHALERPRDLLAELEAKRRADLKALGLPGPGEMAGRSAVERGICKHEHVMTPENTGPRGECRTCKREASQRCKAGKKKGS